MLNLLANLQKAKKWLAKLIKMLPENNIAIWARTQGLIYAGTAEIDKFVISGTVDNKPWTVERRAGSRPFIEGDELTLRAVLDVLTTPAIIIMNRPLKNALEEQAYNVYTDSVQTFIAPGLTQEMRWIALYPERFQPRLSQDFRDNFAVLANDTSHASSWLSQDLADLICNCQLNQVAAPFILMLLRGKMYIQLQISTTSDDLNLLGNSIKVLQFASVSALKQFPRI